MHEALTQQLAVPEAAKDRVSGGRPITKLLIIEGDAWVRAVLAAEFSAAPDIVVAGAIAASDCTASSATGLRADVVLLRLPLVDPSGLGLLAQLTAGKRPVRVVLLTEDRRAEGVLAAIAGGANCYLIRDDQPNLPIAVRIAAGGAVLLSPSAARVAAAAMAGMAGSHGAAPTDLPLLTDQQLRILELLARGMSNSGIAGVLHLAIPTVKSHISRLMRLLELGSRGQLAAFAYRQGLSGPVSGER